MASSNRTQITSVIESTLGTTPTTPRMRLRRVTGESLRYIPTFVASQELRADRMTSDPIKNGVNSDGSLPYEFIYPYPNSPNDVDISSAMFNTWSNTNNRDNDGTADSVITDVATTNTVLTVTTGTAFVAKELYRFTGFGVAGNNGVFAVTTGSATVPRFVGSGITDEPVPPAAARVKLVGFIGDSGDINATASGLSSTTTNFTTFTALAVGKWIKIGGTAAPFRFVTAALNGWARIAAITATALTLDHRPTGWTTETGTALTIKVWFGDQIKNGTTMVSQSIERGSLGQTTPTYILQAGMVAATMQFSLTAKQIITASVSYLGMSGSQGTSTQDASPDAALTISGFPVFACGVHVGRITEGGTTLGTPDFVKSLTISINNNNTAIESIDSMSAVGITGHECTVTGSIDAYFGSNALLTKYFNATATSLASIAHNTTNFQAVVFALPRITFMGDGSPNATAKNQDVMLPLSYGAAKDEAVTNALVTIDRCEYAEL